jgi:hypothetical protein
MKYLERVERMYDESDGVFSTEYIDHGKVEKSEPKMELSRESASTE